MAISKVIYKESANATPVTWMDATSATAAAEDITAPKTAMLADGVVTEGTGSGEIDYAFRVTDFKVPSTKWVLDRSVPNYLKTGGCVHIIFQIPETAVSADTEVISFGADALSIWTSSTNCLFITARYNNFDGPANLYALRLRGSSVNGWFVLSDFASDGGLVNVKLYTDRLVDLVHNNTLYYAQEEITTRLNYDILITAMTNIQNYNYISVGCNQMNTRFTDGIVSLFAIESE